MIKRGGRYFVPKGRTELFHDDHLLLITDDKDVLMKTLSASGISFNNVVPDKIESKSIFDDIKKDTFKKIMGLRFKHGHVHVNVNTSLQKR